MNKQIGLIGLGKMGTGLALNLKDKGWDVIVYNRTYSKVQELEKYGIKGAKDLKELVSMLNGPRVIWTMLTAGEATRAILLEPGGLKELLSKGDYVIEGGNSKYYEDKFNSEQLEERGINYMDVGVSGGPSGARNGACLMIGGKKNYYDYLEELFRDVSIENGYKFFEGIGAGHFVKMVHNGIEYGMMQSIAEGFNLMKTSEYNLNLEEVADIYNNGSVIESRLTKWLQEGFKLYGQNLESVSGSVDALGEGAWTVETAEKLNVSVPVIKTSVNFRTESKINPSYTGKILSMLRNMFGGHSIDNTNKPLN